MDSGASSNRQGALWVAIALIAAAQVLAFVVMLWPSSPREPRVSTESTRSLRVDSISIVTPEDEAIIRLAAKPIEYQDEAGQVRHSYYPSLEMRRPGDRRHSIEATVMPPHGPTLTLVHPRSGSTLIVSCLDQDTFSLSFGSADPPGQALRLHVTSRQPQFTLLDSESRPFVIIDTQGGPDADPKITVRSNLNNPIRVEKHR